MNPQLNSGLASEVEMTDCWHMGSMTPALAHRPCSLSDIHGGDIIGVMLKAALDTPEQLLRLAINLLAAPATKASTRGVARFNYHDSNTPYARLITGTKLDERSPARDDAGLTCTRLND